jgi:hypothetical protein
MTTETKASSALMKWGQDTTDLDKFLRQIMAIVRALDSQVFFTILECLSLYQLFSNIIKWIFVGIILNGFFRFLKSILINTASSAAPPIPHAADAFYYLFRMNTIPQFFWPSNAHESYGSGSKSYVMVPVRVLHVRIPKPVT